MATNPIWVTLITASLGGLLAGLLTLLGVMITQRYTDRREKDRIDTEFKREQARWGHEDAVRSDERMQQRLADSYLEVLRLVEREGQWVEARITNLEIAAAEAENFDIYPSRVKMSEPNVTDRATIAAHLVAFGSDNVRRLYQAWRSTITAIENEETTLHLGAIEDSEAPSFEHLKRLRDVLYPTERAARQAMADAIAEELGHRKRGTGDHPSDMDSDGTRH